MLDLPALVDPLLASQVSNINMTLLRAFLQLVSFLCKNRSSAATSLPMERITCITISAGILGARLNVSYPALQ